MPDANDARRLVAPEVTREEEVARDKVLVLADHLAAVYLVKYAEQDRLPGVYVTKVAGSGAFEGDYGIAEAMMAAGKPVFTWCTSDHQGRAVARKLHDDLSATGVAIRHVTQRDPERWTGTPDVSAVLEHASPNKPLAIKKPASPETKRRRTETAVEDTFDPSPLSLAERILGRPEWACRVLLVTGDSGEFVAVHAQHPVTGMWHDPEATVLEWLGAISDAMEREVYELAAEKRMDPKVVAGQVRTIRSIKTPDRVNAVCRSFAAAVVRFRAREESPSIRECRPKDLDADLRYLGVKNGVVDLHEARLLTPEEAAPAYVTVFTSVPYDPDRYPAATWFLSHLSKRERDWWLDTFGFSLHGIAKRFYGCLAAPDSGKTTAINFLRHTLGPYVASPTPGAIDARQRYDASGHTPGLTAWASPVRLTILDEVKERELHAPLLKDLTGGGEITFRDTYQKKTKKRATGTTFLFANDSAGERQMPQLRTDDPGMRARYRELPFPTIPEAHQVPKMRDTWPYDPEKQAQVLTLLVERAAANPTEPKDIPEATDATKARIRKDSGELGEFAARFKRDGEATLEFPEAWVEWCKANSEPSEATAPGGVVKRDFYRRLSAHVEGLDKPTPLTIKGRKVRGWRGWKLLTVEETEIPPVYLEVGEILSGRPTVSVKLDPEPFLEIARDETVASHQRRIAEEWARHFSDGKAPITRKIAKQIVAGGSPVGVPEDTETGDLFKGGNGDSAQVAPLRAGEREIY